MWALAEVCSLSAILVQDYFLFLAFPLPSLCANRKSPLKQVDGNPPSDSRLLTIHSIEQCLHHTCSVSLSRAHTHTHPPDAVKAFCSCVAAGDNSQCRTETGLMRGQSVQVRNSSFMVPAAR